MGAFELPSFAAYAQNKSLPECLDVDMDGFAGAPADVGLCSKPKDCDENSVRGNKGALLSIYVNSLWVVIRK